MNLAIKLRKHYPERLSHIYITSPDLHFRKSMLHAILAKFADLGLRHLAAIAGYKNKEQWEFLTALKSIPKAFAFAERVMHTMNLALVYEFVHMAGTTERKEIEQMINPI